jgi:predicted RNA-binding Zn ribbon-like protein
MPNRPPAIFIADSAGLDFLNSIATPTTTLIDWLADGEGLLTWLEEAGWVERQVLARLRSQAIPGEFENVAAQARSLREWFRAFVRAHMGKSLGNEALDNLAPLNRLLERDDGYRQLTRREAYDDGRLALLNQRRWRAPESLLLPIGEKLAQLVCEEDFAGVKACEGENCTLMFVDRTHGRARRWCSMAICGNRAKQASFRTRAKAQS